MAFSRGMLELGATPYALLSRRRSWFAHGASLVARFPVVVGRKRVVLDLGCGPGISARAFRAVARDDVIIGLDLSARMLRHAVKDDAAREIVWTRGDAHALPLADASVDVVTGHSFLYLLPDRDRALAEIARVLRPGGRLVLVEPRAQSVWHDLVSLVRVLFRSGPAFALFMLGWRFAAALSGAFTEGSLRALLSARAFVEPVVERTIHGLGFLVVAHAPLPPRTTADEEPLSFASLAALSVVEPEASRAAPSM